MKLVGDGCSDPLNPSDVRSSSLHSVDASERVASEIHESTNNSERDLARAHGRPTTTSEGDIAEGAERRERTSRCAPIGNDAASTNGLAAVEAFRSSSFAALSIT